MLNTFCNKNKFKDLWNKVCFNIEENGYFIGDFFGLNDTWNKTKPEMTFLSKEQALGLFRDFEILNFKEVEVDKATALGNLKHWQIFHVIARKK